MLFVVFFVLMPILTEKENAIDDKDEGEWEERRWKWRRRRRRRRRSKTTTTKNEEGKSAQGHPRGRFNSR